MDKIINKWKKPNRTFLITCSLLVILLLGISWSIVYITGGTKFVYLHIIYIPIMFASFSLGLKGGIITAITAGILLGPLMPLEVKAHLNQPWNAYIYRTFFFIIVSGVIGYISMYLKLYLVRVEDALDKISLIYANTLKNYARMVSVRDEQTSFHCERVAYNAILIGDALNINGQNLEALYWSGLLHDVGKIGVKENILLKPGKLNEEEFEQVKKHTTIGYHLITSLSKDLTSIAEGIHSHHEKWDGTGYPTQLQGKAIPLFGRILSIVDVFEALTSKRPYKDPWEPNDAMTLILKNKGKDFDPELVDLFDKLFKEGKIWTYNKPIQFNESIVPSKFMEELMMNLD